MIELKEHYKNEVLTMEHDKVDCKKIIIDSREIIALCNHRLLKDNTDIVASNLKLTQELTIKTFELSIREMNKRIAKYQNQIVKLNDKLLKKSLT